MTVTPIRRGSRNLREVVGDNIKALRLHHNMKQSELGFIINVSDAYISSLEAGKVNPLPTDKLKSIAEYFSVPGSFLMSDRLKLVPDDSVQDESPTYIDEPVVTLLEIKYAHNVDYRGETYYVESSRPVNNDGAPQGDYVYAIYRNDALVSDTDPVYGEIAQALGFFHRDRIARNKVQRSRE